MSYDEENEMRTNKNDKYMGVVTGNSNTNYKDTKIVINQFNKSILNFKKFEESCFGGDVNLSFSRLHEAGTNLYMSCEWALKNYLSRKYDELYNSNTITNDVFLTKTGNLENRTATLKYLIDELSNYESSIIASKGINLETVLKNARNVNNAPKHNGELCDPQPFKDSVCEIRKIIINFVDKDANLDIIDDSIWGNGKEWEEILDKTLDFNKGYTYVLISNRVNTPLNGIFSIKWDLVIDMDPDSENNGLQRMFSDKTNRTPHIKLLDSVGSKSDFLFSNNTYWVMANGVYSDSATISDMQNWRYDHGRYLTSLVENFRKEYPQKVKAFVYPMESESVLRRIIESFNDAYANIDSIEFFVLSAKDEYPSIEDGNFRIFKFTLEDFDMNLEKKYNGELDNSAKTTKMFPSEHDFTRIDEVFDLELSDFFEPVYINIDMEDENDSSKRKRIDFYKGEKVVSWYGIREGFDVINPEQKNIIQKISQDITDRGRVLKKVYYIPGIGGTTLMRRIAWELREKSPTLILNRMSEHAIKNLQKIYDMTHLPILIFIDNNHIEFDDAKNLQVELNKLGFAFVICYFQRKLKGYQNEDEAGNYAVVHHFGQREINSMKNKLSELLENDKEKEDFENRIVNVVNNEMSPFILSMCAFDKDFIGIKPFIARFLKRTNESLQRMLFALSLADYGNAPMSLKYYANLFNDTGIDIYIMENIPGVNELMRIEDISGKKYIKIKYSLFGIEILKQMSNGEDATNISFLNLTDKILDFIEDSRLDKYDKDQDTLNLLRSLFITRKTDVDTEKPVFSQLITKLQEEHRTHLDNGEYDSSTDAIVRIFNKLVEVYPEEAHFTAHLARFYFYIEKNYDKGFSNIDAAIELSKNETGKADPLLYHMKAMGYSSRIYNKYIQGLRKGDVEDISETFQKIREDADCAFYYFERVRDSNNGTAGHISEINLCIQIASFAQDRLDESLDFNNYLLSKKGNWILDYIDRAETLLVECEQLSSESSTEDLDYIKRRLKALTQSVGENIGLWEEYIKDNNNKKCNQARRFLARAYLKMIEQRKLQNIGINIDKDYHSKIVQLMEDNIACENNVGNIRLWFDSIKQLQLENQDEVMQDAIIKLDKWIALEDSTEAHYYRFILTFIKAHEGSNLAKDALPKLLRDLKNKSKSKYNRTTIQYWYSKHGEGINSLIVNNRNRIGAIAEEEMAKNLKLVVGRISNKYISDTHAYISYNGIEIFFNPSATKGEINKSNINQRVIFGLGFSYDGPRAFNSSIKLKAGNDVVEEKNILEPGTIVKCEVISNIEFYTKVRIIGFNEDRGSIHINDLFEPYSENNRPKRGAIVDAKAVKRRFDTANQCYSWSLTMNIDDLSDNPDETAMGIAFKKAMQK